jgi:hypothetical protein
MLEAFRILVVIFLLMHGAAHIIWFLAAWTQVHTGVGKGSWVLPGEVTIRSPIGKLWGLAALVVIALFTLGAVGLLFQQPGWPNITNLGVFLSFGVVVPWTRQAPGSIAIYAIVANLILMFLLALELL